MKLVENKKLVNQTLDAIRIIDAHLDFPRNMQRFITAMNSIMNAEEFIIMNDKIIQLNNYNEFEDYGMSKTTYYRVLGRIYDKMRLFIVNDVKVSGL